MSTLTEQARSFPRTVIGTALTAVRLPLTAAERIAGQTSNEEWPPSLVFAGAEATVETVLGSLLHDQELLERGRLRQARVTQLREAVELQTLAEQQRAKANTTFEQRQQAAAQRHDQVEDTTERREQQVEQKAAQEKARVRKTAAARKRAVEESAAATEKRLDRQERAGRLAALDAETEALDARRDAVKSTAKADLVDEALDATREERKSG